MASSLPTESALDKSVETFGLGTYDHPQYGFEHGEDSNNKKSEKTLPDDGGSLDPFGPDRLLSYPQTVATTMVPGDVDRPTSHRSPPPDWVDSVVHSTSQTKLPDGDEPTARSDYYNNMSVGQLVHSIDDYTAEHSGDTFASSVEEDSLPVPPSNYEKFDNNLQSLGNYWSGSVIQDQSVPAGFPSTEFEDPQRWQKTNASSQKMKKVAVNINLVRDLSSEFLKKHGKKDLTRRHVMAFLQKVGSHQFLVSDVIRCLKEDHGVQMNDTLDNFPVVKTASSSRLASIRSRLIDLEIEHMTDPHASDLYRRAAADISKVIAVLEKYGVKNG